jgi:serine/threonine protein kinase
VFRAISLDWHAGSGAPPWGVSYARTFLRVAVDKSLFQQCALVSGLLTQAEIDEALAKLRHERAATKSSSKTRITEEALAAKLVELCRLNRWQAKELLSGRTKFTLGPYQVIDSIGQGGMGQVFKAEHTIMGRVVAIKVLPIVRSTPEAIVNFVREIRAQAQLDHEHLVRAYDAGHDGNVHFLVTEYVPGTDLRRLIRSQGRLNINLAASIISQAARGLDHAHARGLIHRDVKPGNLLVTPDGLTKVSDLGLAGYFNEPEQIDAYGGKVVGTADYLAPEQIMTPDKLTPACDVYALGCTLYYAVTTKVPFPGGTPREKARAHCQLQPLDPRRLNPDLSDDFVELIADMMAKQVSQRVQTMSDVVARMDAWVGNSLPRTAVESPPRVPPPIRIPPVIRPSSSDVSDTEPYFLAQPAQEPGQGESSSQVSLGTHPVAAGSQETLTGLPERIPQTMVGKIAQKSARNVHGRWNQLPVQVRFWIMIGGATAGGAIITLILLTLFK